MRQAGIIAAGALYALRNNRTRLVEDHAKARRFAEIIKEGTQNVSVDLDRVQTNIVLLNVTNGQDLDAALASLRNANVGLSKGARGMMRAVTHMDVSYEDCEQAARKIVEVFA
jgi:threonine aldolase